MDRYSLSLLAVCLSLVSTVASAADSASNSPDVEQLESEIDKLKHLLAAKEKQLADTKGPTLATKTASDAKTLMRTDGATTASEPTALSNLIRQVSLRNSVFDANKITLPAEFSYTHPGHGASSYGVDAALNFELQPTYLPFGSTTSTNIGVEYHRNTDSGALEDLFETGLQFENVLGFAATWPVLLDTTGEGYFKVDKIRHFDSLNGDVKLQPVIYFERMGLPGLSFLNTDNYHRVGVLRWQWQPFVGAQYEGTVDTDGVSTGQHVILNYGVELQLFPFFKLLGKQIEIDASYKGWKPYDFTGVYADDKISNFFEARLTYNFTAPNPLRIGERTAPTVDMGVTLKYQNGDDLDSGLKHVDLFTLSLTARF